MKTRLLTLACCLVLAAAGYVAGRSGWLLPAGAFGSTQPNAIHASASAGSGSNGQHNGDPASQDAAGEKTAAQEAADSVKARLDHLTALLSKDAENPISKWSVAELQTAINHLNAHPDRDKYFGLRRRLVVLWAKKDPQAAWQTALELKDTNTIPRCAGEVLREFAKRNPVAALKLAESMIKEGDLLSTGYRAAAMAGWMEEDFPAVLALLQERPKEQLLSVDMLSVSTLLPVSFEKTMQRNPGQVMESLLKLQSGSSGYSHLTSTAMDAWLTTDSYATANSVNQYPTVNGHSLSYDSNGNLTGARLEPQGQAGLYGGATVPVAALVYDSQNRLLSTNDGTNTVLTTYDTRNRVTSRTINSVTTLFLWDGWDLIEERDASGNQIRRYVHGPVADELLMMVDVVGAKYYQQDGLGSVTAMTDGTGAVVEKYEYDVFGTPAIYDSASNLLTATAIGNRFLFTGREWVAEANLYDYRNRVFSPVLGRFLQTDPIGFDADDENLYRYVFNMPGDFVDPYGLEWSDFLVGMGDAFSGDVTRDYIREPLGLNDYYDPCSPEYQAGRKVADLLDWLNPKGWGKNALKNGVKSSVKKARPPNGGFGHKHGGSVHDAAINSKASELREQGHKNLRKNQRQSDANGNEVGKNRPDLQSDKNGKHHNYEWDTNKGSSDRQRSEVTRNDPNAVNEFNLLK